MVDWKSGPGMIDEEEEAEEGEFQCNDTSFDFDPDVAFSYIGDKVQSLLGQFQKDFEGGVVSADNLGPRYGGYGSFLPVHQRSPLSKSPARVQTLKLHESSSQNSKEQCGPNASIHVNMGPPAPSPCSSMGLSQSPKAYAGDVPVRLKPSVNFNRVETLSEKVGLPVIKSSNPLKFRLKLPQGLRKQPDLGLHLSTSGEKSSGPQVESNDSPAANIIQMMTSFPGDVSMLLSPLCDELVNLLEEVEYSAYSGNCEGESFATSEKEREAECLLSHHDLDEKSLSGRVMKSKKVMQMKKREESTDGVKLRAESSYSVTVASLENASDKSIIKHEQPNFRCTSADMIVRNRSKLSDIDNFACPGSVKGGPDIEGRRVKRALSKSSVEVGLQYNSGEEGESTLAYALSNLPSEEKLKGCQSRGKVAQKCKVILSDSGTNASKNKSSGKKDHLVKKGLVNPVMGKPFGVLRKECNIETVKTKSLHAGNLKYASTEQHYPGSLTSLANATEPQIAAAPSNEGTITSVIEDWVECDKCNKWRKLPYGRPAALLGDNWTCSMLDWLPGMNLSRCDVSEDETTQAVHTTFPLGTTSLYDHQTHADNNTLGVISASFDKSHQNFDSDHIAGEQVKKYTLKQKLIRGSRSSAIPCNIKANMNQQSLHMGRTKPSHQSVAKKKLDLKHATNSTTFVSKRKNEHVISDDTVPAKRMRKESFQDADKMMTTKIKISGKTSSDSEQKSRLSNMTALKDATKQSKSPFRLKQPLYKMQDLPVGPMVHESSKGKEVVNLKRKFSNHHEDPQHLHTQQKQQKNDSDFHPDKKSSLPHVEGKEKESKRCKGDAVLKFKCIDRGSDPAKKVGPKGTVNLGDIDKLRKDLWCEEPSTAAISNFSKISENHKNKIKCVDVKMSLGVPVSLSPANHELPNAERFTAANKNDSNLIASLSLKKAKDLLREAEEHRDHSERIKNVQKAGFVSESNFYCFKAAIKLLYGASLLEACRGENRMNIELKPMDIYATVAELCKTCARDYQKHHELAAAALAYKCVEVACIRVVHIKSSATHKVLDLQSSLHMVPQDLVGESPSSSASDVDNSATTDKTTLYKGYASHPANRDIPPRKCSSILQLLDFTKDAIAAMEATKKAHEMFIAACVELEDSQNKEAISSIKKVIDFSFQDVEEFVQLTTLAFSTINSQSLN